MLITNKYIFTHIPKTGGTTCLRILKEINRKGRRQELQPIRVPYHSFIDYDLYDQDIKPIFSLVRNPIDWYQSWYFWAKSTTFDRVLFDSLVSIAGTDDIDVVITTLLTIDEDDKLQDSLQQLLDNASMVGLSRHKGPHFLETLSQPNTYIQDRLTLNQGHLGWMVDRVDNDKIPVTFGKTETLKEDLTTFLDEHLTLTDKERDIIKNGPASGVRPDSARVGLKQATKDLIREKEKVIIDRFGY